MPADGPLTHPMRSLLEEAQHQFAICNACRYCESYCAVFPAIEQRSLFTEGDLDYLSNLCHDCRACHQACMYTEPHEFGLNIPKLLTEARLESYSRNARPAILRRVFERGPLTLLAANGIVLLALLGLLTLFGTIGLFHVTTGPGAFYDAVPHLAMAIPFLLLTAYGMLVIGAGAVTFWREAGGGSKDLLSVRLWSKASSEVATLRWMKGGGGDCYFPADERPSSQRRLLHSLTAYGFVLTFLATISAFLEEVVLGVLPPYPVLSVPVALGTAGGVAVIIGSFGLLWLKSSSANRLSTERAVSMDVTFLLSLIFVSGTGLALLALRASELMRVTLIVHLATVAVFFLAAPYGKFVHGVYRSAAVLRSVQERDDAAM